MSSKQRAAPSATERSAKTATHVPGNNISCQYLHLEAALDLHRFHCGSLLWDSASIWKRGTLGLINKGSEINLACSRQYQSVRKKDSLAFLFWGFTVFWGVFCQMTGFSSTPLQVNRRMLSILFFLEASRHVVYMNLPTCVKWIPQERERACPTSFPG